MLPSCLQSSSAGHHAFSPGLRRGGFEDLAAYKLLHQPLGLRRTAKRQETRHGSLFSRCGLADPKLLLQPLGLSCTAERKGRLFCQRCSDMASKALSSSLLHKDDGVVVVDHGSRRVQSNLMLHEFVEMYKEKTGHPIVEPAHMELAEPSIEAAFNRCVLQGAKRVIISPYFLFPGRHWEKDIPTLAEDAAKKHLGVSYLVTAPIGLHELMVEMIHERMNRCLSKVNGDTAECEMCVGTSLCQQKGVANPQVLSAVTDVPPNRA